MTREEAARALLRDNAEHFDSQAPHQLDGEISMDTIGLGADDVVSRAGLTTLPIQLTVANAAAISLNLFAQDGLDLTSAPTNLASPSLANYKQLLRYLQANPSQVRSVLIQSSEPSSAAPVLSSMIFGISRVNPFGYSVSNNLLVQSYQTTGDFQANRATVPLTLALDIFSSLLITTGTNGSGGTLTFNLNFFIGKRAETRRQIGGARPLAVRPGGRGPAAV